MLATAVSVPFLLGVPAGLVALVAAVRVLRSGRRDPDLAEEMSERARRWSWLAVLLTLVVLLVELLTSTPASIFDGS